MQKFFVFVFVSLFVIVGICQGKSAKHFDRRRDKSDGNNWQKLLCENQTLSENYLTKVRQTISTLQSNESFSDALAQRSNEIEYLMSDDSGSLLSTNCTEFFSGLKDAQKLDRQNEAKLMQFAKYVQKLLVNAFRSLSESSESSEDV